MLILFIMRNKYIFPHIQCLKGARKHVSEYTSICIKYICIYIPNTCKKCDRYEYSVSLGVEAPNVLSVVSMYMWVPKSKLLQYVVHALIV